MSTQRDRLNIGKERYGVAIHERKAENLVRICSMCKKNMGEKPPLDDKSQTHSYCDECLKKVMAKVSNAEGGCPQCGGPLESMDKARAFCKVCGDVT